ncbi:MAG: lysozyme [Desulfobacteraceae bacterium]|nr:lysozyme [Desulfobacteraceae bacterium]
MTGYTAGFSGLLSTGTGGTKEIATSIPGALHYHHYQWPYILKDIIRLNRAGNLPRPLCLFGHSMGAEAVLEIADELSKINIVVDYAGIIDLTLGPVTKAGNNIKLLQEFHSQFQRVSFDNFQGTHEYYNLDQIMDDNIGHSEAARLKFTQDKIVETITSLTKPELPELDMKITPRMALEIAYHEGLVQEAYKDSVGVWTWSIGITNASGHKVDRYIKKPATIERCIEVYIWLLDTKYAPAVRKVFAGHDISESQFTAALSFHWNTGGIERARWVKEWKSGNHNKARNSFLNWNKPSEIIPRRRAERDLFFDDEWSGDGTVAHYQGVSSSGSPINPKRIIIKDAVTSAIQRHYTIDAPVVPKPPNPPVIAPIGDIEAIRAMLSKRVPDLEPQNRELVIAFALVSQHFEPDRPDIPTIDLQPNPSTEAGFLIPNPKKGTNMFATTFNLKSKTTLTGIFAALAGLALFVLPEGNMIVDLVRSIYPQADAGALLTMGLGFIFGRDAIRKLEK